VSIVKSIVVGQKIQEAVVKTRVRFDCAGYIKNKSNLFGASLTQISSIPKSSRT
jgi:hypothetical protein